MKITTEKIQYEEDGPVAYVTLNRPDSHNALTMEMIRGLRKALTGADENESVRAIIVTGAGNEAFCAGGDLKNTMPEIDENEGEGDIMFRRETITTPLIAAVNGYCIAGGMEFLQATDIRIAEANAEFGLQEPRWGLSPRGGSHVRLPRQIPYCHAMEFLLTGELFPAEHAKEVGLVNYVVPDGKSLERAEEIARSIVENSPFAVKKIKETVLRAENLATEEAHQLERDIGETVYDHPEATEGLRAFEEQRTPEFASEWTPSRSEE